ncbi:hypothetical protein IAD21_03268 [Abditibacteriota bacterium]|nr:hypothetical protein IAD21_03268 [Abditibacteriota bacterium]
MSTRVPIRLQSLTVLLTGILVSGVLFAAGAAPQSSSTRSEPTRTPEPTHKPEATPTSKPEPTHKPEATPTAKPEPTHKPEATPTSKPEPTRKPEATPTPKPEPTHKPEPTRTPTPTAVPTPVAGSIGFAEPNFSVRESGGVAHIYVRRTVQSGVGAAGAVSVKYQTTTGGTATAGSDYTVVTGVLSWANGDGSVKTFEVPITNDTTREPTETVFLRLYDLSGNGTLSPSRRTATLSILDDEMGSLDTIAPRVTIVNPAANAHISNLNTISGKANDEGGSLLVRVGLLICRLSDRKYWNGHEWGSREITLETQLSGGSWTRAQDNPSPADLSDDFYQITAVAYDGAGNVGHVSEQVSTDASPPSLTLNFPAAGARLRALTQASGTVSDASGDAFVVVYLRRSSDGKYWNGQEWGSAKPLPVRQSDSGEWTRTEWPLLAAGNYSVIAVATDSVGNKVFVTHEFSIVAQTTASPGSS